MCCSKRNAVFFRAYAFLAMLLLMAGCRGPQIARSLAGPVNDDTSATTAYRLPPVSATKATATAKAAGASPNNPVQPAQLLLPLDEPSESSAVEAERDERADKVELDEPPKSSAVDAAVQPERPETLPEPTPPPEAISQERSPIDLSTALALAGANNLQIAFAAERVQQSVARMDQADVLWVPNLSAGVVYNNHAGRIQATEGDVVEVSRNSLFAGAGAGLGNSPLNGGSGGPARMFVDLPLVDVLFEPLAARQVVRAAEADEGATFNNTLLQVSIAYLNLLQSSSNVAIAEEAVKNAGELARITEDFARAGEGLEADAQRAQAELQRRRNDLLRAKESVAVASAELVRLVRLDPAVALVPTDATVGPIDVVDSDTPLRDLIGQAIAARPESARQAAFVEETWMRLRQEDWRPWMPHLYAGFSGGGFGGAPGGDVKSFSDRTDFDIAAIWELQNLGFGNAARRREQQSAHLQARIAAGQVRDLIASEVSRTFHQVQFRRDQIEVARQEVSVASQALTRNFDGIRGKVLRPIEAQQAIGALATAREQYLTAVIGHNRAQFELLRALGLPPGPAPLDVEAP
jgi:outer membrane protein TolC